MPPAQIFETVMPLLPSSVYFTIFSPPAPGRPSKKHGLHRQEQGTAAPLSAPPFSSGAGNEKPRQQAGKKRGSKMPHQKFRHTPGEVLRPAQKQHIVPETTLNEAESSRCKEDKEES